MKLTRPSSGAMIGGVCAGIARYLNLDVTIIRIAFVLIAVFGGSGILAYLILWAVMPKDEGGSLAEEGFDKARQRYDTRKNDTPKEPPYNI